MSDQLVTPPIRQSVEDANSAQANGIRQPLTEKSWYLFWDRLGQMANRQKWMVNVGTHADRPPADTMPQGAIYVEFDRGVIYQNWTGAWQYLAGTMYGTLAPDQRPTDLGSHDAGFDYRTTDQPPREFIWSGTAWVEVTAVTVGTHASRPASASEAEGNLYVEYDRGGVIYQNWVGGWEYLAGTMWGTLVPDQRPTDLGTRDAGFDFRTTGGPAREFIWSGTAWIEIGSDYRVNGTLIGTRPALNLIAGSNVTISGSDNAGSDRVDVTVSATGGGSGGGAVSSVFGRTGAVVAQAGDYSAYQVNNAVDQTSSYTNPPWILSLAWSKITGAPATGVSSVFGRSGAVVSATGDYTAAQVTNAVDSTGTYANPAWITSLAWSKITGAPSVSSYQTPWLSNINGGNFNLTNVSQIGIGTSSPSALLEVKQGTVADPALAGQWAAVIYEATNAPNSNGLLVTNNWSANTSTVLDVGNTNGAGTGVYTSYFRILGNGWVGIGNNPSPVHLLQLFVDDAAKPGTNTWTIVSDIRTKRNVERLVGGLDIINALEPIVSQYNGKAQTPEGARVVSLDPAKLRQILPYAVSSARGKLDPEDAEETDILGVNTHEILYHLVLAVQQLSRK